MALDSLSLANMENFVEKPLTYTPVLTLTPTTRVKGDFWIEDKSQNGFTIKLERKQSKDVFFDFYAYTLPTEEVPVYASKGEQEQEEEQESPEVEKI